MNNQTLNSLQSKILFLAFMYFLSFHINLSVPVNPFPTYTKFVEDIKLNNCTFPSEVVLPFSSHDTFEYLAIPLNVCTTAEATKRPKEATRLCNEIFDILKSVTCHPQNDRQLPEIKIEFSEDVCTDISSLEFPASASSESLLKHLTDKIVCDMICDDEFHKSCQVLLWGYEVQQKIKNAPKIQKKENLKKSDDVAPNNQKEDKLQALSNNAPGTAISNAAESKTIAANQNTLNKGADNSNQVAETHNEETLTEIKSEAEHVNLEDNEKNINQNATTALNGQAEKTTKLETTKNLNNLIRVKIQSDLGGKPDATTKLQKQTDAANLSKLSNNEIDGNQEIKDELGQNKPSVNEVDVGDQANENKLVKSKHPDNTAGIEPPKNTNELTQNQPSITSDNKKKELPNLTSKSEIVSTGLSISTEKNEINEPTENKQNTAALDKNDLPKKTISEKITPVESQTNLDEPSDMPISEPLSLEEEIQKVATKPELTNKISPSEDKVPQVVNKDEELPPMTTVANLEKMEDGNEIPEPVNKNEDPYNDDDDGFYDPSKNKKTEDLETNKIPDAADDTQNEPAKYDNFPQRNSVGRGPDDIQMIPTFTEQEDSHFFFYFLSIVFILMAGYIIFHNKQKIIALIVEGRHERRRRSHGVGYKKLETK